MSSINEEDFEELIDGLKEAETISKNHARAILKQFRTLRNAADDREKKLAEERAAKVSKMPQRSRASLIV